MKRKLRALLFAALLCIALAVPALAAEAGSLTVVTELEGLTLCLHPVADRTGKLNAMFAETELAPEALLQDNGRAARKLYEFAGEKGLQAAAAVTDEKGEAAFWDLPEGVYLVYGLGEQVKFDPFLVCIPTNINGEDVYHILADPKAEEGTEPTEPSTEETTGPTEPPDPNIPQTGVNTIPMYLLGVFGAAFLLLGMIELVRAGKEDHERS